MFLFHRSYWSTRRTLMCIRLLSHALLSVSEHSLSNAIVFPQYDFAHMFSAHVQRKRTEETALFLDKIAKVYWFLWKILVKAYYNNTNIDGKHILWILSKTNYSTSLILSPFYGHIWISRVFSAGRRMCPSKTFNLHWYLTSSSSSSLFVSTWPSIEWRWQVTL